VRGNHVDVRGRLDFQYMRENLERYKGSFGERDLDKDALVDPQELCDMYAEKNRVREQLDALRQERNKLSKLRSKPSTETINRVKSLKVDIETFEEKMSELEETINVKSLELPNWVHPDIPRRGNNQGFEEEENGEGIVINSSRSMPLYDGFEPKDYLELGDSLDILDFSSATRTSGRKFVTFKNEGAFLELALAQWSLSHLYGIGFTPCLTPDLVHASVVKGCGFHPHGNGTQIYRVQNDLPEHSDNDMCLAGTSEILLAGSMAGKHVRDPNSELPIKLAGFSHCFRAETGGGGFQTRGLFRLHQFSKTEMFVFCDPEDSEEQHQDLLKVQEDICNQLGLHWRTIDMYAHELGHPAYRKFDVQVYMPSRSSFGEVASVSNCTDYQARRLNMRFSDKSTERRGFLHTLNGTAIAVPRIIISLLETHQQKDGSVKIPDCLVPFMGGRTVLRPKNDRKSI